MNHTSSRKGEIISVLLAPVPEEGFEYQNRGISLS